MAATFKLEGVVINGPFFDTAPGFDGRTPVANLVVKVTEICDDGKLREYVFPVVIWRTNVIEACADVQRGDFVYITGTLRGKRVVFDDDSSYIHPIVVAHYVGSSPPPTD